MSDVPGSVYEEMIDSSIPDDRTTVRIDRRGFSPDVAEELGDTYLQNQYIVFDPEQRWLDVMNVQGYSFDDQLTEAVFDDEEGILEDALEEGPVSLTINIDVMDSGFQVTALLDDEEIREAVEDANNLRRELGKLEAGELRDASSLSVYHEEAETLIDRLGDIRREFDVALGSVVTDEFSFNHETVKGYAIHADNPVCVLFEGEDVPWDTGSYHTTEERSEELEQVLNSLYQGGKIQVREEAVVERMKEIAEHSLQEKGYDHERGTVEFYRAVKERTDEMPEKWHVLRDLVSDDDVEQLLDYQTRGDRQEDLFNYLDPQSTRAELVLSRIADFAEDGEQEVTFLELVEEDNTTTYSFTLQFGEDGVEQLLNDVSEYLDDVYQDSSSNQLDEYIERTYSSSLEKETDYMDSLFDQG